MATAQADEDKTFEVMPPRQGSGVRRLPVPGPKGAPVLGWRANMLHLLSEPIAYMTWLNRKYGDVVTMSEGTTKFVFVFSPEYNHQVLSDQMLFYNGEVNSPSAVIKLPPNSPAFKLFSGITTRNAEKHKQQRRLLMPAFHKKRIDALRDTMVGLTERHIADWQVGDERDLLREMKGLTLSVAVQTILGLDPRAEGDRVRTLMEGWLRLTLSPLIVGLPYNVPGLPFHTMLKVSEKVEAEIRAMIERRREQGAGGPDALSMLIQANDEDGTYLTDDELIGQATALFVAGHETTASALTWTLFFLAQHPPVLADLLDELEAKLHGEPPTTEQTADLPLLDRVIKESMRLIPPGLWFLRVPQEDTRFGPYDIPAGTSVLWSPAVTHRRPDLYSQPKRFLPDRWLTIDPSPYEYLPFGAGSRRCLGATFALMEMKLVLPILLQRFGIALHEGQEVSLGGSPLATPKGGMPVSLTVAHTVPPKVRLLGNIRSLVDLS